MNAAELLTELIRRGIQLQVDGHRLRFHPRSAVTPVLLHGLKTHKRELMQLLEDAAGVDEDPWLEEYDADGCLWFVSPQYLETFRLDAVDPPDPCAECGTLELRQTLAGNWRCPHCDPPTGVKQPRQQNTILPSEESGAKTHSMFQNSQISAPRNRTDP